MSTTPERVYWSDFSVDSLVSSSILCCHLLPPAHQTDRYSSRAGHGWKHDSVDMPQSKQTFQDSTNYLLRSSSTHLMISVTVCCGVINYVKHFTSDPLRGLCLILSDRTLCKDISHARVDCHKVAVKAVHMCVLRHVNKSGGRGILTFLTYSYLSPWPHTLHSLAAVRLLSRWQPWHQQRAGGQVLFERGSEWKEEMEDKKRGCEGGRGKKWERGWKKRREILLVSVDTLASLLHVTRATAACRPACLPSIPCVSLIDEVRALGQPGHICTSAASAPPPPLPFLCPYSATFLFGS